MFTKNRVTGVTGSTVRTSFADNEAGMMAYAPSRLPSPTSEQKMVIADASGGGGDSTGGTSTAGGANLMVRSMYTSNYNYYMTGLLPADPQIIDTSTLALFYRKYCGVR
jgi:hypothetical protein